MLRGDGIAIELCVDIVTKNAPKTKKGFVMKITAGEINYRFLIRMANNDKEKLMKKQLQNLFATGEELVALPSNATLEKTTSEKNLNELSWGIYNMCQALVSVVEVYPEFEEEINRYFRSVLDTATVKTKSIVSKLPYAIDR